MSAPSTCRLLAQAGLRTAFRPSLAPRVGAFITRRAISQSSPAQAEPPKPTGSSILTSLYGNAAPKPAAQPESSAPSTATPPGESSSTMADLMGQVLNVNTKGSSTAPARDFSFMDDIGALVSEKPDALEPYHMHIYSHKHNTHVTVTKPDRGAIISMSCGNIGFRKARRKTYDAAYQLMAYVLERLKYAGWEPKINRIELVLRGFGQGREACVKVLMAPEGEKWRKKIVRVADGTRIKFGGTRSPNPKRRG
ncbi:hypothetical protein F5X68DRAFT_198170 [Plectosphaerella plurivora]|uniref:Ribosomal protein S11 n=1 Tax=Plectosphaerella plurivora TaxID=936078 RepID=A0A9P8VKD3_9PEZI|nr:hypothetical protein F5X68DRAFT_198170 [Plectosphaerella plurivora]